MECKSCGSPGMRSITGLLLQCMECGTYAPLRKPRWRYQDATGVERVGYFENWTDHGGTDVTYFFRREDGTLDLCSGSRLKQAERIWE